MDLDSNLCFCFHIKKRKIVNFVKQTRPGRASQISDCFGAGTGCGWCIPFLKRIHRHLMAGDIVEAGDITAAQYEAMRGEYLRGIREGKRQPHTAETEELPVELKAAEEAAAHPERILPEKKLPEKILPEKILPEKSLPERTWDVSDYFSRPSPADSDPDMLV